VRNRSWLQGPGDRDPRGVGTLPRQDIHDVGRAVGEQHREFCTGSERRRCRRDEGMPRQALSNTTFKRIVEFLEDQRAEPDERQNTAHLTVVPARHRCQFLPDKSPLREEPSKKLGSTCVR